MAKFARTGSMRPFSKSMVPVLAFPCPCIGGIYLPRDGPRECIADHSGGTLPALAGSVFASPDAACIVAMAMFTTKSFNFCSRVFLSASSCVFPSPLAISSIDWSKDSSAIRPSKVGIRAFPKCYSCFCSSPEG